MTKMKNRIVPISALLLAFSMAFAQSPKKTEAEIKQLIVKGSIEAYSGSCPCPFTKDKAGKNCGARSAYSKPGGASPLCYDSDVTQKMVAEYRKLHE